MRKLAYECAVKFNVKVPDIWTENKCAWSKLVFRLSEMKYGPINQAAWNYWPCDMHLFQQIKCETVFWQTVNSSYSV